MASRRYTEDDVYQWLEMYNDGMTHEDIALEIGTSYGTVGKRLRKLPEYRPRPSWVGVPSESKHNLDKPGKPGSKAVHQVVSPTARSGHRRRGRL